MDDELKKVIVAELKKEGLEIGEDAAISAVKALFKIIPVIALKTETKIDDLVIPVLGVLEAPVMAWLDKIDGREG